MFEGGLQHQSALTLIGRRQYRHIRDTARIAQIEATGMGRTVGADLAGTIDGKGHVQVLQCDVVQQLIIGTLQKGRVDRDHRLQSVARHARGEGHRVLLGDADVEIPLGETGRKCHQARALTHRRRDRHQPRITFTRIAHPVGKDLGEAPAATLGRHLTCGGIERRHPVIDAGITLGRGIPTTLAGHDVQEARTAHRLHIAQGTDQQRQIVAVDRADVIEAELLEQRTGHHHALHVFFPAMHQVLHPRQAAQHVFATLAHTVVETARQHPSQIVADRPHRLRDRHVVVVQHHQQVEIERPGMVECLECHTRRQCAVADHRDVLALLAGRLGGYRHAQRCADRGTRVAGAERVVRRLVTLQKTGQAVLLPQRRHAIAAPGKDLVRIGLVPDVPHEAVFRGVKHVVQGHCQFHHTEPRGQVPAGLRNRIDQETPHLGRQCRQFARRQRTQTARRFDLVEQQIRRTGWGVGHYGDQGENQPVF